MATNHRATIEAVNAAFSENRLEDFFDLCAEDIEMGVIGGIIGRGKDELRSQMNDETWQAPVIQVTDILVDGDRAVCDGVMHMDKKSGEKHRFAYADFYTFSGDKIKSIRVLMSELKTPE